MSRPHPAITKVPVDSGYKHPRCYAAEIGGCGTKISGEHAISLGALDIWADSGSIDIGGLSWLAEGDRSVVPIKTLGSNILCKKHNEAMSPLDAVGTRLASHLDSTREFMLKDRRRRPRTILLLNGLDVERWLLKTLCGLICSGSIELQGIAQPREWRPPIEWLQIIFGVLPMPDGYGLHLMNQPGERGELIPQFSFACLSRAPDTVLGLAVSIVEKRFLLAMTRSREGLLSTSLLRPAIIRSSNGLNEDLMLMSWEGVADRGLVEIHFDNPRKLAKMQKARRG